MEGDMGNRAFGMGRKLASVDLQLLILGLLAEKPRHAYENHQGPGRTLKGFYIPSRAWLPALTYLEEIGHATVEVEGPAALPHHRRGQGTLGRQSQHGGRLFAQFNESANAWTGSGVRCAPTKPGKAPTPSTSAEVQRIVARQARS